MTPPAAKRSPPRRAPPLDDCSTGLVGLPAAVDAHTRLLILGSFPGAASLAARRYYAHPRNQFWPILGDLLVGSGHEFLSLCYQKRIDVLLAAGVGLWDVYAGCSRAGSLDSAIRDARLNDFSSIVHRCPGLACIAHNGAESHRHHPDVLRAWIAAARVAPRVLRLPSTSPAHASWSYARKRDAWREALASAGIGLAPCDAGPNR